MYVARMENYNLGGYLNKRDFFDVLSAKSVIDFLLRVLGENCIAVNVSIRLLLSGLALSI